MTTQDHHLEEGFSLAAARAMFRAPQPADTCWSDAAQTDGTTRACGRQEVSSIGLCADHLMEIFALDVA